MWHPTRSTKLSFKVGDKVKIELPDDPDERLHIKALCYWNELSKMEDTIGKVGTIKSISNYGQGPYLISFGKQLDSKTQGGWYYHEKALQRSGCPHNKGEK
jgi:hypothetical protein